MSDYDDDFEIEEDFDNNVKTKANKNKKKDTVEKTTISSLNRNDSRETGSMTKKTQPLNNTRNDDVKKNSSTLTLQPQDFSSKLKQKPLIANTNDSKKNGDSIFISDFKQQSESRSSDKQFQKSPITSVYQSTEIKRPNFLEDDDKPHSYKKADGVKKYQFQLDDNPASQHRDSHPKMPQTTKASQLGPELSNNYEQIQNLINSFSLAKNDRELDEENKQLRKRLRDMNNLLNSILLRQDISKLVPKNSPSRTNPSQIE